MIFRPAPFACDLESKVANPIEPTRLRSLAAAAAMINAWVGDPKESAT